MPKRYAIFNADNTLMTRLVSGVNHIPEEAVEVDESMFFRLTQETDGVWQLQGDGSIAKGPLPESLRTDEDLAVSERGWRDAEVSVTEWLVTRHRDEQDMQLATTLPAEQFAELLSYRQALRDWPAAEAFPDSAQRPVAPRWLAEQTQ